MALGKEGMLVRRILSYERCIVMNVMLEDDFNELRYIGDQRKQNLEFVQPHRTDVACLIGLPNFPGPHIQATQPSVAIGPGVNANGVSVGDRHARFLRRMPADHRLARLVRRRVVVLFPIQHEIRLFVQRNFGVHVAVDKDCLLYTSDAADE